jgi:transposase-like protein
MRTEEETKYDLDERIFEMYDSGMSIKSIQEKLNTTADYVNTVLTSVQVEENTT